MKKYLLVALLFAGSCSVQAQPLRKKSKEAAIIKALVGSLTYAGLSAWLLNHSHALTYLNNRGGYNINYWKIILYIMLQIDAMSTAQNGFRDLAEIAQNE